MRQFNRMIFSASAVLAAALIALPGAALAQGDGEEAVEDEWVEIECTDEAPCDETTGLLPPEEAAEEEAAAEEPAAEALPEQPVLIAPGSTDESNPGGSTKPGTTPEG